jgi:ribosomal protein RSM22 (predicted rRNA methylase)
MEPGGARVLLAADDVWPESQEVAAVDVGLDLKEVTAD